MANIRRVAGRLLRQKRKPAKHLDKLDRGVGDRVIVFESWVRPIDNYVRDNIGVNGRRGENNDRGEYEQQLRHKYGENESDG
jgi:hypothetical protein